MKINCCSCQAPFECGAYDPSHCCWCQEKPRMPIKAASSCLCEKCFDERVKKNGSLTCFRLHVSYVGDKFCGFQEQKNDRTVEGELKKALSKISLQDIKINAAGRTDAGVHAKGQVVSTEFFTRLSLKQLTLGLASLLPPDLSVWRIDKMPLGFDARRMSVGKQYIYRISQGLVADPFLENRALHVRHDLDVDAMARAAAFLVGEKDFSSFRSSQCTAAHAIRYIWHVGVTRQGSKIEIDVRGNAFCLNMVRIIVGTLIEVGKQKRSLKDVEQAVLGKERTLAGITAKAHGLTLNRVYYPDNLDDSLIPKTAVFPRFPIKKETWGYDISNIVYGPL